MQEEIRSTIEKAIKTKCNLYIRYSKYDGELSERVLSNVSYTVDVRDADHITSYKITQTDHITGYCHLRNEERTFYIKGIINAELR